MRRRLSCRSGGRAGARVRRVPPCRRSRASARTRVAARTAARAIRLRGYAHVHMMLWDVGQPVRGAGVRPRSIAELLPQGALVFGRRGPSRPSILDAVLEEAGPGGWRRRSASPPAGV